MRKQVLMGVNLVLVMLITGVFWGTWFTLTRGLDTFPPDSFIRIGKTIIGHVAWPMRILMPLTLMTLLWLCVITRKDRLAFYLFLSAFALMLVTLLITVLVEVPIDNQIKTWTADAIPGNWTDLRERWGRFHTFRTVTSVLSFILLTAGVCRYIGRGVKIA